MSSSADHPPPAGDDPGSPRPEPAAYEQPDIERPASSAPTEPDLEQELPIGHQVRAHDPYAALRNRDFLLFMVIWWISVIGHQVLSTALAWEMYDRTGSEMLLGWVAGVQVIPLLLLALPAGHLADRMDRRRIISVSTFGSGLCSVGLAFLSYRDGSIPWMFGLLILSSAFLVLGRPARSSLLPLILPKESFANGVTWNSSAFQISAVVGPALGGAVVAVSLKLFESVSVAYLIDAVCAFSLASLIFLVRIRKQEDDGLSVDRSVLAGFKFVWRTKIILATMMLDLFAVLLGGATWLMPVFAKDILQVGPTGQGWLRAAEAMGAFTMSMLIAHLPPMKHAGRAMLLSVAGFGVATIVFGLSRNFWLSFAMLVLIGALDSVSVVVRHTLVQVLTPDSMRGRVSAVNNISIGASNELGGLESGLVAAFFGPVFSVVAGGVGTILVVAGVALKWPQVRKFGSLQDARPPGEDTETDRADLAVALKQPTSP